MSILDFAKRIDNISFHNQRRQSGFTLIELVIVLIIIGILAGILVPKYEDLIKRSKEAKLKAIVGNVRTALMITIAQRRLDDAIPEREKHPTVVELADNIQGGEAEDTGIGVTISGEDYIILTYKTSTPGTTTCDLARDGSCNVGDCSPITSRNDRVYCVSGWRPDVT